MNIKEGEMTYTKQSQEEIEQDWYNASINAKLRKQEGKMKYRLKSNKEEKETTVLEQGELYVCCLGTGMGSIAVYSYPYGASNVDQMQLLGTDDRTTRVALDLWRKLRPDEEIERNPEGEGWRVKGSALEPFKLGAMYQRIGGCNDTRVGVYAADSRIWFLSTGDSAVGLERIEWRKLQPGEVIEILEG